MNIKTVRVKVDNDSQMRIAMTLLQEVSGRKPHGRRTVDQYVKDFPVDGYKSVGCDDFDSVSLASWTYPTSNNIPFSDFVIEAVKMLEEKQIKIDNYIVEFKSNGVQVGCTFVSKKIVEKIYKKLFNN